MVQETWCRLFRSKLGAYPTSSQSPGIDVNDPTRTSAGRFYYDAKCK
jgi:hypothetical protein